MKNPLKVSLVIFAAVFLFTFGCTGSSSTSSAGTINSAPSASSSGSSPSSVSPSVNSSPASTSGTAVSGLSLAQLLTQSIPAECTINISGQSSSITVYMEGSQYSRTEMSTPTPSTNASTCTHMVMLKNGANEYMGCADAGVSLFPGSSCDWIQLNLSSSTDSAAASSVSSFTPDQIANLTSSMASQIQTSCQPWTFDPTVFSPPAGAQICTMAQIFGNMNPPS